MNNISEQCSNQDPVMEPDPQLEISEENIIYITDNYEVTPADQEQLTSVPGDQCFDYDAVRDYLEQQRKDWPRLTDQAAAHPTLRVYKQCRDATTYNMLGPRVTIATCNNRCAWERYATGHPDDQWIIECVTFGFPLQYRGPPLFNGFTSNHPSATNYDEHVRSYIETERSLGAIVGPFNSPPFEPWCHVAPLMSREKADKNERRIIVDFSFPPENGPNAFVIKNSVFGQVIPHALPTVQEAINIILRLDFNLTLGSIDIERAYRNFVLEPLDWLLACICYRDQFYVDTAMPFGSRISSLYMQRMALFIQRAAAVEGVATIIYLDDVLVICNRDRDADASFKVVRDIIRELGLPIAWKKVITPTRIIKFLGIIIDLDVREVRMPVEKIHAFMALAKETSNKKYVSRRTLQSIAGHINHLTKCVPASRIFMNRVLDTLRGMNHGPAKVTDQLKKDLSWFVNFLEEYNGKSMIVSRTPSIFIEADSCLSGGGGVMGRSCYAYRYPEQLASSMHISQLEALNCVIAARTFLWNMTDVSVQITCDNEGAIATLSSGRGRDPIITAVARAFWFFAAKRNIHFNFNHAPGHTMLVADALSREHLSDKDAAEARRIVREFGLQYCEVHPRCSDYSSFL